MLRLLVVDDDAAARELARIAADEHASIALAATASDGPQGVVLAARTKPDLVLLDLDMPGESGLEILPRLLEVSPASTVVMFSSSDEIAVEKTARDAGAAAYFVKGLDDVETVLDAAVRLHAAKHSAGMWAWCGDGCDRWYYTTSTSPFCPVCGSVPTAFSVEQPSATTPY